MATGQKFPEDYEPATLEHPARNVPKPEFPEAAKQETEAGAQAFLNYHSDATWYAIQTGDTTLVREVTASSCKTCTSDYDQIDGIYQSTGWAAGGMETGEILDGNFIKSADGIYRIPVEVRSSGIKIIEDGALAVDQHPYESGNEFTINIDFFDSKWTYITASPRGA